MKYSGGVIFLLVLAAVSSSGKRISYDGYTVYQAEIKNKQDAEIISRLDGKEGINFWTEIDLINHKVDIMVAPNYKEKFIKYLEDRHVKYIKTIEDVGKLSEKLGLNRNENSELNRASSYMSYGQMLSFIRSLSNITNPQIHQRIVKLERIGQSFKGKGVFMIKISSDHSKKKPIILLEAGMHAREWAGPPTVLYLAQELVKNYTFNKDILRNVDIYIIPVANPDGYEYSRRYDRMWRKTRSEQGGCIGVDGNRNFNHFWGVSGASDNPCSDTFKGFVPFSEKETQNIRNVGIKYSHRLLGYIAVHSYGSFLLYPWGYTTELAPGWENLDLCARAFVDTVEKFSGTRYTHGSSSRVLYEAAGGSDDWFKGKLGTPFAYTMELPGSNIEGFHLPSFKLQGVARETFEGMKSLFECFWTLYKKGNVSLSNDYDEMDLMRDSDYAEDSD